MNGLESVGIELTAGFYLSLAINFVILVFILSVAIFLIIAILRNMNTRPPRYKRKNADDYFYDEDEERYDDYADEEAVMHTTRKQKR